MDLHRLAEVRSFALHLRIAARLRSDPAIVERARRRVAQWRAEERVAAPYRDAWWGLLNGPLEELCAVLVDENERACVLRHVTPFAGVIEPRERWQIWREAKTQYLNGKR